MLQDLPRTPRSIEAAGDILLLLLWLLEQTQLLLPLRDIRSAASVAATPMTSLYRLVQRCALIVLSETPLQSNANQANANHPVRIRTVARPAVSSVSFR